MKRVSVALSLAVLASVAFAADTAQKAGPGMGELHAGFAKPVDVANIKVAKAKGRTHAPWPRS